MILIFFSEVTDITLEGSLSQIYMLSGPPPPPAIFACNTQWKCIEDSTPLPPRCVRTNGRPLTICLFINMIHMSTVRSEKENSSLERVNTGTIFPASQEVRALVRSFTSSPQNAVDITNASNLEAVATICAPLIYDIPADAGLEVFQQRFNLTWNLSTKEKDFLLKLVK